jgi:monofunctional glycosyltransferase
MKRKGFFPRLWRLIKRVFIILFVVQLVYIIALKWVNPPITITQLSSVFNGHGLKRDYVRSEKISPNLKLAVMASEDQLFPDHAGFDGKNRKKAMDYNDKKPGRVRGASTISQQTAKNVFLWQGRSWIRKALEVYFTKMIEWIWGKERIIVVYLNVIEMGEGVFGAEAAAQAFFNKDAASLSKIEAARIAAALPHPKKYTVKPLSAYVARRQNWVLRQMIHLQNDPDIKAVMGSATK